MPWATIETIISTALPLFTLYYYNIVLEYSISSLDPSHIIHLTVLIFKL